MKIKLDQIIPDPDQPRKTFKEETLQELRDSYDSLGLIQPLTVRPHNDKFMIIVGERRYRAAKLDGLVEIECIERKNTDDKTAREMQLIENSQQEDISDEELGQCYINYCKENKCTIAELARRVGKDRRFLEDRIAIVTKLSPSLHKEGASPLSFTEKREIQTIPNHKRQEEVAQPFIKGEVSSKHIAKIAELARKEPSRPVWDIINGFLAGKIGIEEIARAEALKMASDIPLETPEDKERAAKALLKEARREAQAAITPEEKAELAAKKRAAKAEHKTKTKQTTKAITPAVKSAIIEEAIEKDPTLIKQAEKNIKRKKKELEQARLQIAKSGATVPASDRWHIEVADINTYQTKEKFDFIITDPPYPKEFLPLYEALAKRANEWLKPTGLLIAMCGQSYLDQIYKILSAHLKYYWTAAYLTPGQPTPLRQRQVNSTWKPILIYSPTDNYKGKIFGDVFTSIKPEKDNHDWGQSVSGMLSIISQICLSGQTIFDPFLGSGSTGVAALQHDCIFYGIDIDEQSVNISKKRLAEVK